jgi:DNA-binding response OmpR family regulator
MKRIELRRHGRVLIIDDDPDYLEAMREALSREGHEVVCCEDPRAADAVVASERPDVVLLDRHMSTLSGLEVCVALRKRVENDHLPILLVTNDTSLEAISVAVEAGVNDFVDKAAPFEILRLRVRAALRMVRLLQPEAEGDDAPGGEVAHGAQQASPILVVHGEQPRGTPGHAIEGMGQGHGNRG